MNLARLALGYWAPVFALAFVLGAVRVTWVAPTLGPLVATVLEVPLVLGASWLVARKLVANHPDVSVRQALVMGLLAFAILMAAELALAIGSGTARGWLAGMRTLPGAVGLAGQIGFALMPWAVVRSMRD